MEVTTKTDFEIAAVIVNWNNFELTQKAVQSVLNSTGVSVQVIVIDNGSKDGSVHKLHESFSTIEVVANERNLGFAKACNQGWLRANELNIPYIFFLNNDAFVEVDCLEKLEDHLKSRKTQRALSPFIFYAENPDLIWFGGGIANLWLGRISHKYIRKDSKRTPEEPVKSDYLTGCAILVSTAKLSELGGFDLVYGLYSEDVDLSFKLVESGVELFTIPEAKSYHAVSVSSGGELSPFKAYHRGRSNAILVKRWAKSYQYPTLILFGVFGGLFISLKMLIKGKPFVVKALWSGILNGFINSKTPAKYKLEFEDIIA